MESITYYHMGDRVNRIIMRVLILVALLFVGCMDKSHNCKCDPCVCKDCVCNSEDGQLVACVDCTCQDCGPQVHCENGICYVK